ncbi:CPBP family intramembrane glutamic endopeptidase [Serratia entomophila]|uniref:CPBP family intramembrane metalloprotease n=1 Tax=Serratia entomophila TaxID=42906 RepID=A0ABY5CVP5_9GAMM|nr:CPBP family intramembrane glutamic endopeptidase [Serratia entomophila]USV02156.1 CPBP family intramembrane metalloprotease [Serratia entomophila]CAI0732017.1 CAAX amino terminal protease self- immunity [Serratia entomophila]CAI0771219.1 CAAX amino terminal protease self- immunity [Serratia entomophila]CAI0791234.1 CAAX amino terminal protease self- immunity [Serratia entomophila]CAI0939545.1 CAAX amino terminal protease self- immunity [Serratia entomophila]
MWGVLAASLFFLPFNRRMAWLVLAASAAMGLYHGVLTPLALGCLLVIVALAWLRHHFHATRPLAVGIEVLVVAGCVALFLHLVPGIHNQLAVSGEKAGPLSAPFTMYYNFDKALVPFLLFACLPTLFATKTGRNIGKSGWIALIISVPALLLLGVALGGLKIELHNPPWLLPYIMANLFFVCMAEEALFRGYLQQRLSQWLGHWPALVIAAVIFGAAHLAGGMLMVIFATLAGVIYGLAWMWSGRLWVPIMFHFGLNLTHLLFFTYPLYQHS